MNINAIIHEQIDWNGIAKSFQLKAQESIGDLWIAFPTDYTSDRNGPFYFLDKEYEELFRSRNVSCRQVKVSQDNFYHDDDSYYFQTSWQRITTKRNYLTYYALYLPVFATPTAIKVTDSGNPKQEFSKIVFRDDEVNRFIVYIECKSKYGFFNFDLSCRFQYNKEGFVTYQYRDASTMDFYADVGHWKYIVTTEERQITENFFITNQYNNMRDQYNIEQAGAVGPNSNASQNTFNQLNNSLPSDTDYGALAKALQDLRNALVSKASSPEHFAAISEVAQAEVAAKSSDGKGIIKSLSSAGKWAIDIAKELSTDILKEVIQGYIQG